MLQDQITAGDTLNYTVSVPQYPATAGWVLKLRLVPRSTGVAATYTAAASGADHRVTVSAAVTATWVAGAYGWATWVEKAGERYSLQSGQVTVLADPAQALESADTRTHAQKVLDAVQAVIEGRASSTQAEYQIAGRAVKHIPMAELLALRDRYAWMVRAEKSPATAGILNVRL